MSPGSPLVDASWLAGHLGEVVVADVRWYLDGRSGRAAYEAGHIPGAVHVDIDTDLAQPAPAPEDGRHPLPAPESFAAAMARLGIGDDDRVVAYDDAGGAMAARLVWMLRVTGHDAALLDGGIDAWGGPLETAAPARSPASFTVTPWPDERLAGIDEVAEAGAGGEAVVIDARAAERYRGEPHPVDRRPGHVPGARSLPYAGNLGPGNRFLPASGLRKRFAGVGVEGGREVIAYCGSGVTACHDLLALEMAGFEPGRLFVGSWSAWTADPDRPAEVGGEPERD